MRLARHVLILTVMVTVALLFMTDCGKKPEPEIEPTGDEVPEEQLEAPEETAPPEEPEPVDEQPSEVEISMLLRDIHFDFDDSSLRPEAEGVLNANAGVLLDNMWVNVVIEGHCDERGTVEYNLALGERRALSAKRYLVSYGIDESRISIISYGKERPLDQGHSEEAWAKNRRAHFAVR